MAPHLERAWSAYKGTWICTFHHTYMHVCMHACTHTYTHQAVVCPGFCHVRLCEQKQRQLLLLLNSISLFFMSSVMSDFAKRNSESYSYLINSISIEAHKSRWAVNQECVCVVHVYILLWSYHHNNHR